MPLHQHALTFSLSGNSVRMASTMRPLVPMSRQNCSSESARLLLKGSRWLMACHASMVAVPKPSTLATIASQSFVAPDSLMMRHCPCAAA